MSELREVAPRDGSVNAALANAVVQVVHDYTGRGPTRARARVSDDLVTVLMGDLLTKAERTLAENGKADLVLTIRREFQNAMRDDLIAAVESLTGRRVVAFMSDNHIEPDLAVESFVLDAGADAVVRSADDASDEPPPPAAAVS